MNQSHQFPLEFHHLTGFLKGTCRIPTTRKWPTCWPLWSTPIWQIIKALIDTNAKNNLQNDKRELRETRRNWSTDVVETEITVKWKKYHLAFLNFEVIRQKGQLWWSQNLYKMDYILFGKGLPSSLMIVLMWISTQKT